MPTDYIPLYRKYRPQSLLELIGQEAIVQTISNAIAQSRLAHAYLFCGPRGTGKTSSARILAKSLNCSSGPTAEPCQTCPSCISVTNGTALDVCEIDAASNNGVDQIRELTERVQFRAIEGKYRIYIIDEVHMLSTQAFNALLKTLEEPPPNVIFIFATTEAHKVLPTIVSRCQRFDFSRITRQQIEGQVQSIALKEDIHVSPEAVTFIARHAKGGMRDALSLLDQVSVLGRRADNEPISVQDIRLVTGAMSEEHLLKITTGMVEQRPTEVLTELNGMIEHGVDAPQIVKELIHHFRNLLLVKTCPEQDTGLNEILDVSEDLFNALREQAKTFAPEELPQIISRLAQLENQLRHASSPLLWLEIALLELCYRQNIHTMHTLSGRLDSLEQQLASGAKASPKAPTAQSQPMHQSMPAMSAAPQKPVPVKQEVPVQTAPAPMPQPQAKAPVQAEVPQARQASASDLSNKADLGRAIIDHIDSVMTKNLLEQQAELIEATDTHLVFAFSSQAILNVFNRPEKIAQLEKAVIAVTGKQHRIELTTQSATPTSAAPAMPQQTPKAAVVETPVAQALPVPPEAEVIQNEPLPLETLPTTSHIEPSVDTAIPPIEMNSNPERDSEAIFKASMLVSKAAEGGVSENYELLESKRYTAELLQGKLIDI